MLECGFCIYIYYGIIFFDFEYLNMDKILLDIIYLEIWIYEKGVKKYKIFNFFIK